MYTSTSMVKWIIDIKILRYDSFIFQIDILKDPKGSIVMNILIT